MVQMVINHGEDSEEILELADMPEFVLVNFCDLYLRHRDIRNPEIHNILTDTVSALKVKAQQEADGPGTFNRYGLKEYIKKLEETLQQYPPYDNAADEALI